MSDGYLCQNNTLKPLFFELNGKFRCGKDVENSIGICYAGASVRRTILLPVTVVSTTLVLAGIVVVFGWLEGSFRYLPDIPETLFFVLPFAIGVVTVRNAFRSITPIVLLAINYAVILLVVLLTAGLPSPVSGRSPASVLPDAPFTVWKENEVWHVLERSGLELRTVIIADRTVRQEADRGRLLFDERRTVHPGERLVTFESAAGGITGSTIGARVPASLERDLAETRIRLTRALDRSIARPFELSGPVRNWVPPVLWERWYAIVIVGLWSLALVLVWTPARASRWPLLNMALAFVYLRLLVALPRLIDALMEVEMISGRIGPRLRALSFPVSLLVVVLVFAIIAILLPKIDRREVGA